MPVSKADDVNDLTDAAIVCRDLGHAWDFYNDRDIVYRNGEPQYWVRELVCLRCSSKGRDYMDGHFDRAGHRKLDYVDGYLMTPGHGRVSRSEARREYAARHLAPAKQGNKSTARKAAKKAS